MPRPNIRRQFHFATSAEVLPAYLKLVNLDDSAMMGRKTLFDPQASVRHVDLPILGSESQLSTPARAARDVDFQLVHQGPRGRALFKKLKFLPLKHRDVTMVSDKVESSTQPQKESRAYSVDSIGSPIRPAYMRITNVLSSVPSFYLSFLHGQPALYSSRSLRISPVPRF